MLCRGVPAAAAAAASSQHHQHHICLRPAAPLQQQQRPCRQRRAHVPAERPAATAAAAAADAAVVLQLPFSEAASSKGQAKLASRRMPDNPLQGLWQAAAAALLRVELAGAALVDRHAAAPFVMAGLAGAMTGAGLDGATLVTQGLPPYLPDLLTAAFGVLDTSLVQLGLTAAALPLTVWALRAWWAANLQLLTSSRAGPLQQLVQQVQQRLRLGSSSAEAAAAAAADAPQSSSSSHWLAAAAIVVRGACLCCIVSSLTSLVAGGAARLSPAAATSSLVATALSGLAAVVAAVTAFGLLLAGSSSSSSGSGGSSSSSKLLAPLLAAELAWVAAMVGLHPLVNTAAGAVVAASLAVLQRAVVLPRLQAYRAAPGDSVTVTVRLCLAGTRPVFDATEAGQPLQLTAGPVPAAYADLWQRASSGQLGQEQQQPEEASSSISSEELPSLRDVTDGLAAWLTTPGARWRALEPFVADAAQGLFLGQSRVLTLYNPQGIGYSHPGFTWWQPAADVAAKFGGQAPQPGDAFWFPVADGGATVLTRVTSVGAEHVELDANFGVTDAPLDVHVTLVGLGPERASAAR